MGSFMDVLSQHSSYFLQFFHKIKFCVQPARGVYQQKIMLPCPGCTYRIICYRAWICAGLSGNHRDFYTLSPVLQLINCCGAKSISRGSRSCPV